MISKLPLTTFPSTKKWAPLRLFYVLPAASSVGLSLGMNLSFIIVPVIFVESR